MPTLIGRDLLVSEVRALLDEVGGCLLFGAPGIGKTEAARAIALPEPTFWVEDFDSDELSLLSHLAGLLDCDDATVVEALGDRLVILDDAPPTALAALGQLGQRGVRWLATARRRISGVAAAYEVDPLSLEHSVALLRTRLRELGVTRVGEADLLRVARFLDGHPLSLTVAASLMTVMGSEELLKRMTHSTDQASMTERLEVALGTAWEELDPALQAALVDCSVFHRTFTAADAEAVVRVDGRDSLDLLVALRAETMICAAEREGAMRLLAPIREFTRRRAIADEALSDRRERARERHRARYIELALEGPAVLNDSFIDVREAVLDARVTQADRVVAMAQLGVAFARAIGVEALHGALAKPLLQKLAGSLEPRWRDAAAWGWLMRGEAAHREGDWDTVSQCLDDTSVDGPSEEAFRTRRDRLAAIHEIAQGDPLATLLRIGAPASVRDRVIWGESLRVMGRHDSALELFVEARVDAHAHEPKDAALVAQYHSRALLDRGDREGARAALEEAMAIATKARNNYKVADLRIDEAVIALDVGRSDHAESLLGEALELFERRGDQVYIEIVKLYAAIARDEQGSDERAAYRRFGNDPRAIPYLRAYAASRFAVSCAEDGDASGVERAQREAAQWTESSFAPEYTAALRAEFATALALLGRPVSFGVGASPARLGYDVFAPVRLALRGRARRGVTLEREGSFARASSDGARFRYGEVDVEQSAERPHARVLATLVRYAWGAPGEVAPAATLMRFGWPETSAGAKGMKNRLRVTVSALRKLGLGDCLASAPGGYRLDCLVRVEGFDGSAPDAP